jgi:hypothetical protein
MALTSTATRDGRGLVEALVGDGRPVLTVIGLVLAACGAFALFQSATGHFLPHDVAYLGMDAQRLCALQQCRIVHFMFHDRVAFGGVLIAVGILYAWLAEFPLQGGERWAWRTFAWSGACGFASFLTYIGYGYLDTWHGTATLVLLALFALGLSRTRRLVAASPKRAASPRLRGGGIGRVLLILTGLGLLGAGLTISVVGTTRVFVPQDLTYIGLAAGDLRAINPRLVPLIAHDRAGFGGALLTCGVTWLFCVFYGRPSRSLWQALLAAGTAGFACAIGIHWIIGYLDFFHLAPAVLGALLFSAAITLAHRPMCGDGPPLEREGAA